MLHVLGADGRLGRRVGTRLAAAGIPVEVLGRDADPARLPDDAVVANLADTRPEVAVPWARAGATCGGYLDAAPTERSHRALVDAGLRASAPVLPGVGVGALGDALAAVAAERVAGPDRVDVTTWVPARTGPLRGATPREREELLAAVASPFASLRDGEVAAERIAEERRLAWFPRPVGPHHAVAVPGTHWRTVPDVLPGVRTVRTSWALRSSTAELLQGIGNLARLPVARGWLDRLAARPGRDRGTADERWAMVVEVATSGGDLARGWAYGTDRHGVTAAVVARTLEAVLDGAWVAAGVQGVPALVAPEGLLDHLAVVTDLRWSVSG